MEGTRLPLTISQCATLACLLEASAPKVGNVNRGADFDDLTFNDFLVSAVAIGPPMEAAATTGIGQAVLEAVTATRQLVATNTNLGMALAIAPLAAVPRAAPLTTSAVRSVLERLTPADCQRVYQAIRVAQPGGLGKVPEMDIADQPPERLLDAMRAAADRDLIALQHVEAFALILDELVPALASGQQHGWSLTETIIHTHLSLLAKHPDSLIARKCGPEVAKRASAMAGHALEIGAPGDEAYYEAVADFDFWLRSDGHRRNPGTTADLIAAALFAALRDGRLIPPFR